MAPVTPPAIRPTALASPFLLLTVTAITWAQSTHLTWVACACLLSAGYGVFDVVIVWASAVAAMLKKTRPQVIAHSVFFMIESFSEVQWFRREHTLVGARSRSPAL